MEDTTRDDIPRVAVDHSADDQAASEQATTGVRIRDAVPGDAEAIAEIYNQSIAAGGSCMVEELQSAEDMRRTMAGFNGRETILVLVDDCDTTLGWGIIKRYSDRRGYRFACETAVYLDRQHLGKGYGTRLKLAQIERCREFGYRHLVAKIFSTNVASIEYNKRLGYTEVGVQKDIGFQGGQWQDVTILQLILERGLPDSP